MQARSLRRMAGMRGALSRYTPLSIAPLLLSVIAVADLTPARQNGWPHTIPAI